MNRSVIILIAAAGGLAAGFAVRLIQKENGATSPSKNPVGEAVAKSGRPDRPAEQKRLQTPLAAGLEQQLSVSTGVSRWLEWMAVMELARPADFPDLARLAAGDSVVLRMVSARWIELDRRHFMETLVAESKAAMTAGEKSRFPINELAQQLFEDWSKSSPADAVAALSAADLPPQLLDLRHFVLNNVMDKDPELALRTMADWHVENYAATAPGVARWAAANPRHAAEFALSHPAGYATHSAMEVIGKVWAKSDPAGALEFAAGRKDRFGTALASEALREWAAADTGKAAAWLEKADAGVRKRLSGPMLEVWAKADTGAAMGWIQEHLTGSAMDEAVASVLKGAADISVSNAAALVAGMDSSAARAKAAASVARKWWPEHDSGKAPPPEALAWLGSLDPVSIRAVVEQVQWQWSGGDRNGFSAFLASPAGLHAPEYAFTSAARNLAQQDPRAALEWAAHLPEERKDSAGLTAFMTWQSAQGPDAVKWLRQLPANDPRRESWHLAMVEQFVSDRTAAQEIARSLAAGKNPAALKAVQALPMSADVRERLLSHLQIR